MSRCKYLLYITCCLLVLSSCSAKKPAGNSTPVFIITAAPEDPAGSTGPSSVPTDEPTSEPVIEEGPAVIETRNNNALRWIGNNPDASSVILTKEQIDAENRRMLNASDTLTDITSFPGTVSGSELKSMIESASLPSLPKYTDGGREITKSQLDEIVLNRNISAIQSSSAPLMGVVTRRTNIRRVPSDIPFYSSSASPHDRIQETEIGLGQLALVLHESTDGLFVYIQSGNYKGWVRKSDIAIADSREEWLYYQQSEHFVIVTEAVLKVGDVSYDLGARIPLVSVSDGQYVISVPERTSDGRLVTAEARIDSSAASVGYVPFTYENYVALAFRYEGYRYSWGGRDDSVDCSGFTMNVLRCFGLTVPRDTSAQNKVVGSHTNVSSLSSSEKASRLRAVTGPACVYIDGHVRLYLGYENGMFYYIDSSVAGNGVSVTVKDNADDVIYIDVIGG